MCAIDSNADIRTAGDKWQHPALGYYKYNIDASTNGPIVGIGVVIRDWRGHFMGSFAYCIMLLSTLVNVRVEFVQRSANFVAHSLAKMAGSFQGLRVYGLYTPNCILASLASDLS